MNRTRRSAGVALALAVGIWTTAASAQEEPSAADISAARALGQEGVKLAESGNCAEALDKLARAEKIFHAPTTLARLGECQVQLGKVVEGTENLNRVVREQLAPNAPQAFVAAQERAKKLLPEAKAKIAKLKIAVAAPGDAELTVKVDGEPVPLANLNTNRPMDPGEHLVEASAPGYLPASAKVRLAEGGVDSVALTLEPDPNAPKRTAQAPAVAPPPQEPQTPAPADTAPPAEDQPSKSKVPAFIALGVGAVGLGVGTVFGLSAISKKDDLDASCQNKVCPGNQQDTIDSAKTAGTISTVGFAVGAVGLGVGAYLLLTSGSGSASATVGKSPRTVQPLLGLGSLGVRGTF